MSEYAATGLAVVLGCAVAFGVRLLGAPETAGWIGPAIRYLLYAGLAAPVIAFSRAALRAGFMPWLLREQRWGCRFGGAGMRRRASGPAPAVFSGR